MGAVCECINTPPIIVFPFGTPKEEIEEWEKDVFRERNLPIMKKIYIM